MEIVNRPDFDRSKALEQQIELLKLKKEHIENLIDLAAGIKLLGVKALTRKGFEAFDTRKIDEYARQAKAAWGTTDAYKEYEQKSKDRTREEEAEISSLGQMYAGGGDFTTNIDGAGGEGTA